MNFQLRQWFRRKDPFSLYKNNREQDKLYKQLLTRVCEMEKELSLLKQTNGREKSDAQIVIEHLHIEHFKVDKVDYENNFGALGIKELKGQLNIGANYRTGMPGQAEEVKEASQKAPQPPKPGESPRYTIKAREQKIPPQNKTASS
ncbi:hypothetical protein [Paenibacillus abyssi]|nr:hypothetical protein [Paenibacillus abyssi]